MKTKIKIAHDLIFILTALFTFSSFNVLSQSVFYPLTDCPDVELEEYAYPGSGGLLKPERTDRSSGSSAPSEARLNVLIVFYPSLPISRLGAKELPLRIRRFVTRDGLYTPIFHSCIRGKSSFL